LRAGKNMSVIPLPISALLYNWRLEGAYEIETSDLPGVFKELAARRGTADIVMSDAIDLKGASACVFTPVAEKVMAKDVARRQAGQVKPGASCEPRALSSRRNSSRGAV
jgi:hypothetical protein